MVVEPNPPLPERLAGGQRGGDRRVELVHESLLSKWPRLVRWRTQDAEGAQLRDELRQAAQLWEQHGRAEDYLWTRTAFREYQLWRERYPGGLTALEEEFAAAMTSLAGRRRRWRRIVLAATIALLTAVAAVIGVSRQQAIAGARRAEAANLVSLGRLALESNPSATVGHVIASLELADSAAARQLALAALWRGPTALVASDERSWNANFTPDGKTLIQGGDGTGHIRLIRSDGSSRLLDHRHLATRLSILMGRDSPTFWSLGFFSSRPSEWVASLFSASDERLLGSATHRAPVASYGRYGNNMAVDSSRRRGVYLTLEGARIGVAAIDFDGVAHHLGELGFDFRTAEGQWRGRAQLEPGAGSWIGLTQGEEVFVVEVEERGLSEPRRLGRHPGLADNPQGFPQIACDPRGRFLATASPTGEILLWALSGESPPIRVEGPPDGLVSFTDDGAMLRADSAERGDWVVRLWSLDELPPRPVETFNLGLDGIGDSAWDPRHRSRARTGPDQKVRLWPGSAPPDANPIALSRGDTEILWEVGFHPSGSWLTHADQSGLVLWPLDRPYPAVIRRHEKQVNSVLFGPKGSWLASSSMDDTVRIWPLEGEPPPPGRILLRDQGKQMYELARTPDGQRILVATGWSGARLLDLSGTESHDVPATMNGIQYVAITPDGRLAAAVVKLGTPESSVLVWALDSGEVVTELPARGRMSRHLQFAGDGSLLVSSETGLHRFDLATGVATEIVSTPIFNFVADLVKGRAAAIAGNALEAGSPTSLVLIDLSSGATRALERHGTRVVTVALGPDGELVATGDRDGVVRVGKLTGEEPHLLLGHEGRVDSVAVDPRGRWIASGGFDATVRLWPMPDLSQPPLHTLPRSALIARLGSLTNYRVVRDADAPDGWKLSLDPFPGWETVPTW